MKYCVKCGKELCDEAVICTGCGCMTDTKANSSKKNFTDEKKNIGVKILNFFINIFFALTILFALFSIYNNEVRIYTEHKNYSSGYCWPDSVSLIAGIVVSGVNIFLMLMSLGMELVNKKENKLDVVLVYCSKIALATCFLIPMALNIN